MLVSSSKVASEGARVVTHTRSAYELDALVVLVRVPGSVRQTSTVPAPASLPLCGLESKRERAGRCAFVRRGSITTITTTTTIITITTITTTIITITTITTTTNYKYYYYYN